MALKVKVVVRSNCVIADVSGEMDEHTTIDFKLRLYELLKLYKVSNVLFDFTNLDFIDSTGIGLLLSIYNKIRYEGKIYLTGVNRNIEKVVLLTGLYKICEIICTKEEAMEQLGVA